MPRTSRHIDFFSEPRCAQRRAAVLALAALLTAFLPAGARGADANDPVAYSLGRAPGERAALTITLPPGWSIAPREQASARVQKHVFTASNAAFPYLWVELEQCDARTLEARLEIAGNLSRRAFLSGGELGESYFDRGRGLIWSRTKDEFGNASVSAEIFKQGITRLKFFDNRAHLFDLQPEIIAVVDNLRMHDLEDNVIASNEPVPLPDGVSPGLFAAARGGFPYLLMIATIVAVGVLVYFERKLLHKRYQEQIEEAKQQIAGRKQAEKEPQRRGPSGIDDLALDYLQATKRLPTQSRPAPPTSRPASRSPRPKR